MVVLFVVAFAVFLIFAGAFLNSFLSNLGINPNAGAGGDGDVFANCAFLSDEDARAVFGGNADAIELSGLAEMSIGFVIDNRVLAGKPDCWVTEGEKAFIARIALHQGGDASAVFAAEREAAMPTSEDQGGGVTLENDGYFGGEVSGLGDEAFCTGTNAIMAGVLVRQGDRVLYVSVGPADENSAPEFGVTDDGVVTAPALCDFAQEVARSILR